MGFSCSSLNDENVVDSVQCCILMVGEGVNKRIEVGSLAKRYIGVGPVAAAALVVALGAAGVAVGFTFPKFEAKALLVFPEKQSLPSGNKLFDVPNNVIELPVYKRIEASYDSTEQLSGWLAANGLIESPVAQRLIKQSANSKFWNAVSAPVLPFSKLDQKTYGDIKDASSTQLIGLQLTADARTGSMAAEMIDIMARYYTDAVLRERVRAWVVEGQVEAQGTAQLLRGEIVRSELEISLATRRVEDMKAIIARYPEASRMDSRQVVSVNEADGGDRYLSPIAQLVGAETKISQQKEQIRRLERRIQQRELLASFFSEASGLVNATLNTEQLLKGLTRLADRHFSSTDGKQEWVKEARLRVNGALDNFTAMQNQFGVRNGVAVSEVASRDPARLGVLGLLLGLGLLGGLAFLRAAVRSMQEDQAEDEISADRR